MKFLIAGAGAIGAYIGARMERAGVDVTLFARGPQLAAMEERGLMVRSTEGEFTARPKISGDLRQIGPVDVVLLTVKAHSLTQLAPQLASVLHHDTIVVSTQNGLPWWYFQGHSGELQDLTLERVDPGGVIATAIEPRRVLGSLVYFASEIVEPGVVRHMEGNRISLGEPGGARSERARHVAEALIASGFRCPVTTRIRHEIWVKILGNVAFNPVSALTRATMAQMLADAKMAALIRDIMLETEAVARRLGLELPISVEQRMAGAANVGEHKTSMLQDLEAGRPLELEAIVGAVLEVGERLNIPMPHTRSVYACARLLAESRAPQASRTRAA